MIFSHVLYQLSYLGPKFSGCVRRGRVPERARSLTVALAAVHPFGIRRRTGNAIAVAEPFQEIAVLAALAAEGRVLFCGGSPAQRTGFGFRRFRHIRQKWSAKGQNAR